jgi:hypothetical protein
MSTGGVKSGGDVSIAGSTRIGPRGEVSADGIGLAADRWVCLARRRDRAMWAVIGFARSPGS